MHATAARYVPGGPAAVQGGRGEVSQGQQAARSRPHVCQTFIVHALFPRLLMTHLLTRDRYVHQQDWDAAQRVAETYDPERYVCGSMMYPESWLIGLNIEY